MILSDREIQAASTRGALRITPFPGAKRFSSTAVDLTLGPELRRWKDLSAPGGDVQIRPAIPGFRADRLLEELTEPFLIPADGFALPPGEFILGWTAEKLQLPFRSRIAARVEGRSSLARFGLGIHVTAPTVHAGFGAKIGDEGYEGSQLQLEIWNVGKHPVVLDPGIAICQLIFEWVDGTPEKGYAGQFASQGPQLFSGASAT
jgi:dCTP deaminase